MKLHTLIFILFVQSASLSSGIKAASGKCCHFHGVQFKQGKWIPAPLGQCAQLICKDAETNLVDIAGCKPMMEQSGCELMEEDLSKPFPACCARTVCREETTVVIPYQDVPFQYGTKTPIKWIKG